MKRLLLAALMAAGIHAVLLSSGAGWFSRGVQFRQEKEPVILSLTYLPSPDKPKTNVRKTDAKPNPKPVIPPKKPIPKKRKIKKVLLKPKPRSKPVKRLKPVPKPKLVHSKPKKVEPVQLPPPQRESKKELAPERMPGQQVMVQEKVPASVDQADDKESVRTEMVEDALAELPLQAQEAAPKETAVTGGVPEKAPVLQVARPLYRKNPRPGYPRLARRRGYQGIVILEVLVRRDGTPGKVRVFSSSGYRSLDKAAAAAVEKWSFAPGSENGIPVDMWVKIPIHFQLD